MRRKLVVGNWKMNFTLAQGRAWAGDFVAQLAIGADVEVGVAPTYLALNAVAEALDKTNVMVGGQDAFWMESGAYTGLVGSTMLQDAGATFCILGHSERRGRFGKLEVPDETLPYFSDTDNTLNLKLRAVLDAGLMPIMCCGETQTERDSGMTDSVIERQLRGALHGFTADELKPLVLAYEPVWASARAVCNAMRPRRAVSAVSFAPCCWISSHPLSVPRRAFFMAAASSHRMRLSYLECPISTAALSAARASTRWSSPKSCRRLHRWKNSNPKQSLRRASRCPML